MNAPLPSRTTSLVIALVAVIAACSVTLFFAYLQPEVQAYAAAFEPPDLPAESYVRLAAVPDSLPLPVPPAPDSADAPTRALYRALQAWQDGEPLAGLLTEGVDEGVELLYAAPRPVPPSYVSFFELVVRHRETGEIRMGTETAAVLPLYSEGSEEPTYPVRLVSGVAEGFSSAYVHPAAPGVHTMRGTWEGELDAVDGPHLMTFTKRKLSYRIVFGDGDPEVWVLPNSGEWDAIEAGAWRADRRETNTVLFATRVQEEFPDEGGSRRGRSPCRW